MWWSHLDIALLLCPVYYTAGKILSPSHMFQYATLYYFHFFFFFTNLSNISCTSQLQRRGIHIMLEDCLLVIKDKYHSSLVTRAAMQLHRQQVIMIYRKLPCAFYMSSVDCTSCNWVALLVPITSFIIVHFFYYDDKTISACFRSLTASPMPGKCCHSKVESEKRINCLGVEPQGPWSYCIYVQARVALAATGNSCEHITYPVSAGTMILFARLVLVSF